MKFKVQYFKQAQKNDCSLACLKMVYAFHGTDLDEQQFKDNVQLHDWGASTVDLALFALKQGFEVEMNSMDLNLFGTNYSSFSKERLIEKLEVDAVDAVEHIKSKAGKIVEFLEKGGKLNIKIPEEKDITSVLDKKKPVIASVIAGVLHNKKSFLGHFVVVNGYTKTAFSVLDPFFKGEYLVKKPRFLFGWNASSIDSSGNLLVLTPTSKAKEFKAKVLDEVEW